MRWIFLVLFSLSSINLFGEDSHVNPKPLSIKEKKKRFFASVLPPAMEVEKELRMLYKKTKLALKNPTEKEFVALQMKRYKTTSPKELLKRIYPHPLSITLAQAAMESAWGTSRFFREANNIFGMWSTSTSSHNTIKAAQVRKNGKQIYLQKYPSLKDSIRVYYKTLARHPAYKKFREVRYRSDDPYEIVAYLDKYSEKKDLYPIELIKIIYYNRLTRYDAAPLPR